jgi:hypothetical protein
MVTESRPLTRAEAEEVFRIATTGFQKRFAAEIFAGMTDKVLEAALKQTLGIFGGSCGPARLDVIYQGSGLKIWGSWEVINHITAIPLFSGAGTIAMAREVYGITDPSESQMTLF